MSCNRKSCKKWINHSLLFSLQSKNNELLVNFLQFLRLRLIVDGPLDTNFEFDMLKRHELINSFQLSLQIIRSRWQVTTARDIDHICERRKSQD